MCALATPVPPLEAEEVVRKFYASLARGEMVDALDLFSTDAVLTDEEGNELHGIRSIASSLLEYRTPRSILLDRVTTDGPTVVAEVRSDAKRRYRGVFSVSGGRIRSWRREPVARRSRGRT